MAVSRSQNLSNVRQQRLGQALLQGALLGLLLTAGCSQKPVVHPSPMGTPVAVATAVSSEGLTYEEILERYQAPLGDEQNGWSVLRPLLVAVEPDVPVVFDRLSLLDLSNPDDLAFFDKEAYPTLKEALTKPFFVEPYPLLSGRDPLMMHYRSLRTICDLLGQRADLLWAEGKKDEALEMSSLPLSLAKAMQARLETVSVNLFSLGYSNTSLGHLAEWAAEGSLKEPELAKAREILAKNRPDYGHLRSSLDVDFAQLEHSLGDETTRTEVLGLGLARAEDVKTWVQEVRGLKEEAQKLYGPAPDAAQSFNDAVMKSSAQVRGLVLDYPPMLEMQKRNYASYLATELALALESYRLAKKKTPALESLLSELFSGDEQAQQQVEAMLLVQYATDSVPENFLIAAKPDAFKVTAPDGVSFYQR